VEVSSCHGSHIHRQHQVTVLVEGWKYKSSQARRELSLIRQEGEGSMQTDKATAFAGSRLNSLWQKHGFEGARL
jgi:hypothetical protein